MALGKCGKRSSSVESFGISIGQLPHGAIRFNLAPHYLFELEYHPSGRKPIEQRETKYSDDTLKRCAQVDVGWYLVEYSSILK